MKQQFIYRMYALLRNKTLLFWTLLFPLLLSTMFHFAFSQLRGDTPMEPISVAVVDNEAYRGDVTLQKTLEELGKKGENQLLDVTLASPEKAETLLRDDKVDGVLTAGQTLGLSVKQSGINQSILKSFLDEYIQTRQTLTNIITAHPEKAAEMIQGLGDSRDYTRDVSLSKAKPDTTLNYFYTIIAMVCMYGGFWGIQNTSDMMPNLSPLAARRSVSPMSKRKMIFADQFAAVLLQFVIILIVLAYLAIPLGVDFGTQWGYILLGCFTGCVFGVALGTFIGTLSKPTENVKTGIFLAFTMTGCFLAGMMVQEMKDIMAHHAPFVNYINPAALITDSFYALYYFDTHTRFFLNIGILWGFSILLWATSILKLRRQRYASI